MEDLLGIPEDVGSSPEDFTVTVQARLAVADEPEEQRVEPVPRTLYLTLKIHYAASKDTPMWMEHFKTFPISIITRAVVCLENETLQKEPKKRFTYLYLRGDMVYRDNGKDECVLDTVGEETDYNFISLNKSGLGKEISNFDAAAFTMEKKSSLVYSYQKLQILPTVQQSNTPAQLSVFCKTAEDEFDTLAQVTSEDIKKTSINIEL
ncbi:hypothetical protein WISP_102504 [Willisornis vidua]|uniref:Uncharacterized protein n=1 Tax=Willisornis vidua TaxID=1566151 RepID=A0ABQ9CY06_9PASS|nr:hypothetical protein WISP_102504 [Willisornis vidua]